MATIGQQLTVPETGWRRYDDTDSRFKYDSSFNRQTGLSTSQYYNGVATNTVTYNGKLFFKFYGTKLRIIQANHPNRSNKIGIIIDGNAKEYFSEYSTNTSTDYFTLNYEKTGLTLGAHTVSLTNESTDMTNSPNFQLDCFDIDSNGYLIHPILNQVSNINSMATGDCLPCRYTAGTSGAVGYFSELGTCIANEIPVTGVSTPDGLFNFIKVAPGKVIADRNLQNNISWDTLNSVGLIEGTKDPALTYLRNKTNTEYLNTGGSSTNVTSKTFNGINDVSITGTLGTQGFSNLEGIVTSSRTSVTLFYMNLGQYTINNLSTGAVVDFYIRIASIGYICVRLSKNNIYIYGSSTVQLNVTQGYKELIIYNDYSVNKIIIKVDNEVVFNGIVYPNTGDKPSTDFCDIVLISFSAGILRWNFDKLFYIGSSTMIPSTIPSSLIRSLSGGCSYADINGNTSLTLQNINYGAFPTNNEWDSIIASSTLNDKITAGDDSIWNYSKVASLVKETPVVNSKNVTNAINADNTQRVYRGYSDSYGSTKRYNCASSNSTVAVVGFRPVLEFLESSAKASNLFY